MKVMSEEKVGPFLRVTQRVSKDLPYFQDSSKTHLFDQSFSDDDVWQHL